MVLGRVVRVLWTQSVNNFSVEISQLQTNLLWHRSIKIVINHVTQVSITISKKMIACYRHQPTLEQTFQPQTVNISRLINTQTLHLAIFTYLRDNLMTISMITYIDKNLLRFQCYVNLWKFGNFDRNTKVYQKSHSSPYHEQLTCKTKFQHIEVCKSHNYIYAINFVQSFILYITERIVFTLNAYSYLNSRWQIVQVRGSLPAQFSTCSS